MVFWFIFIIQDAKIGPTCFDAAPDDSTFVCDVCLTIMFFPTTLYHVVVDYLVLVMEVINGDYGNMVSKLSQAVLSGECDAFNDRYKVCLPKRCSYTSSSKGSVKGSMLSAEKKRVSSSCLSHVSSSNHSNGSVDQLMTSKNSSFQITDSSSKESSEEVRQWV